uniref:Uncharacterized protein n=1 Tax=Nelumbo nucifera TaxID=4432 RepID=A0A822YQ44_NELNU|nr:TPA_asm: hypothetical protein HUJ06_005352 [Nelumbo nucifera]
MHGGERWLRDNDTGIQGEEGKLHEVRAENMESCMANMNNGYGKAYTVEFGNSNKRSNMPKTLATCLRASIISQKDHEAGKEHVQSDKESDMGLDREDNRMTLQDDRKK